MKLTQQKKYNFKINTKKAPSNVGHGEKQNAMQSSPKPSNGLSPKEEVVALGKSTD